jgi:hypothetical protein
VKGMHIQGGARDQESEHLWEIWRAMRLNWAKLLWFSYHNLDRSLPLCPPKKTSLSIRCSCDKSASLPA